MHGCRVEEEVGARAGQVPDKPAPGDGPGQVLVLGRVRWVAEKEGGYVWRWFTRG